MAFFFDTVESKRGADELNYFQVFRKIFLKVLRRL